MASKKTSTRERIVTLRPNGQLTLPAELRERVHARAGDVFVAEAKEDYIVLRPKKLVDAEDAWFWTPEWQKMEREASADIAAGRLKRFKTMKDLIDDLEK